jgi:phosphate-selective porin OprO/OprP
MILLFILPEYLICQDTTRVIPDGTQGETMKVGKVDTALAIGNWYEFDGPGSSLKLGGGFLYEYAAYIQDDVSKEQISMEPAFAVRDFRITMSGRVKTKSFITWKVGIMYDGPARAWLVRETGVMIGIPK